MPSNTKTFRLNNMSGGINTTAAATALASFDFNGNGVQAEAQNIENFTPLNYQGQRSTKGFILLATGAASVPITGIYRYLKANGANYLMATQGTTLSTVAGGTLTPTGLTTLANGAYTHFTTALDKAYICDSASIPGVFDGVTASPLTTTGANAAADSAIITGSIASIYFQNRLFFFGVASDPSRVFYSVPNDPTQGYSSNFIQCDVNDGEKITALDRFFIPGTLQQVLIVGKERSVGIITGDGSAGNPYTYQRINREAGIAGFRQITQFGQDFAYLTQKGVSTYVSDSRYVNLTYNWISEKVRDPFLKLNPATLKNAISWYDWKNTRISFAVPEAASATNNVIWHYDTRLKCWYKERWFDMQDCTCAFVDYSGTLLHGDSSGKLYSHDPESYSFAGQPISYTYTSAFLDFGAPNLRKRIVAARATLQTAGSYGVSCSTVMDWGARQGKTNTLMVAGSVQNWGNGTLWALTAPPVWGASPVRTCKFYPSGFFRSIQFNLTGLGTNNPLDMFELEFDVEFSNRI